MREWLYLIGFIFVFAVMFPKLALIIGASIWLL
jgi:hypothetical protein